jgi:hypothetical protein
MSTASTYSGEELSTILTAARLEYKEETKTQSPPILTENLGVENFWEAEKRMLERIPAHISEHGRFEDRELLEDIVLWKFSPGVGRIRDISPERVEEISQRAFESDSVSEALSTLAELNGIGPSMAGTVLTFTNPDRYTVMDPRATSALRSLGFWSSSSEATVDQYEHYCLRCQELSQRSGLSLRDVDRALYIIDGNDPSLLLE